MNVDQVQLRAEVKETSLALEAHQLGEFDGSAQLVAEVQRPVSNEFPLDFERRPTAGLPVVGVIGRTTLGAMAKLHMLREIAQREMERYLAVYAMPYPFPKKTPPRERRYQARRGRKRGRTTRAVPAYPGAVRIHGGSYSIAQLHEGK